MSHPIKALSSEESLSLLGGKMAKQIILKAFIERPEKPFPSITAPMYLNGKIPANPKIPPCTNELAIPYTTMIMIMIVHAVSSERYLTMNGIQRVSPNTKSRPVTSLIFNDNTLARKIPIKLNIKFGALIVSPNTKSGL